MDPIKVIDILLAYKRGVKITSLARRYKVREATIKQIVEDLKFNPDALPVVELEPERRGRPHGSRLSEDEIVELRTLYNDGCPIEIIAEMFGISKKYVYEITSGRAFENIGGPIRKVRERKRQ